MPFCPAYPSSTRTQACRNFGHHDAVVAHLQIYGFPGNIRELRNIVEYALAESGGHPIEIDHIHFLGR